MTNNYHILICIKAQDKQTVICINFNSKCYD